MSPVRRKTVKSLQFVCRSHVHYSSKAVAESRMPALLARATRPIHVFKCPYGNHWHIGGHRGHIAQWGYIPAISAVFLEATTDDMAIKAAE